MEIGHMIKTPMIATLGKRGRNAKNLDGSKERVASLKLVAAHPIRTLVDVRFWKSRSGNDGGSPVYCSVWVGEYDPWTGHGTASGYGYHKQSAALSCALQSAGISLSADIAGVGETAMVDALYAIGRALGFDNDEDLEDLGIIDG